MKLLKGTALILAFVSCNASAAYSVGLRLGMVEQELSVDPGSSKQTDFSYGLEISDLKYVDYNFSWGWALSADYSDVSHDNLGDVSTLDVMAGPLLSYRIASVKAEYCNCKFRRVHDGISVFIKPQVNYWSSEFGNDSESDLDFAYSAGFKYQDSNNYAVSLEYQNVSREVTLNRSMNSKVDISDDRVILSLGYRF